MRVVMSCVGSAGDVLPFAAIGRELTARGHDVALFASGKFEDLVRGAGIRFVPVGTREEYDALARDPDLWHPRRAFAFVMRPVLDRLPRLAAALEAEVRGSDAVLLSSTIDLAGRVVAERLGASHATIHLAPAVLRTLHRTPRLAGFPVAPWAPRPWKRLLWRLTDRIVDPAFVPELNAFRASVGLAPVRRPLHGWWNSPRLVLGLWPEWFGPTQPDWPAQLRLTGFPRVDDGNAALDAGLLRWLEDGEPPVLFTFGSAMVQGARLFRESTGAARALGVRALLVTTAPETVPEDLPETVRHVAFAPFARLFPRCAAVVHHGGVGTSAAALAAGMPALAVPMAHDQHDNASRLVDLGVGATLPAPRYTATRAADALRALLRDVGARERARALAVRLAVDDAVGRACDEIEALVR